MNPHAFIVGCPRSGTTMVQRLLNAHRSICVPLETHWVPVLYDRRQGVAEDGTVGREFVEVLLRQKRFEHLKLTREDVESILPPGEGERMTYAEFVGSLYTKCGARLGKPLVCDKTPDYARFIPTLSRLWPEARFVHVIRDGRSVALSLRDWDKREKGVGRFTTWTHAPLMTAALYWEWNVRLAREDGADLPPGRYYELRYEDLIADAPAACAQLCRFLGVEFDEEMLQFNAGRIRHTPGLSAKKSWASITPGLRDWRVQMPAGDVAKFEAVAAPLLDELGYGRGGGCIAPHDAVRADQVRTAFHRPDRRFRLPQRWGHAPLALRTGA